MRFFYCVKFDIIRINKGAYMNYHAPILLIAAIVGAVYCINLSGYYWEEKDKNDRLWKELSELKNKLKSKD